MILYHGSKYKFDEIDLSKCKDGKDFGKGFYLTRNLQQAIKWAKRNDGKGFLYSYEFNEECLEESSSFFIRKLTKYDKEWADFVCKCRLELYETRDDIIYDRMADSKFFILTSALERYYYHQISLKQLLFVARFTDESYDQYCFKTEKACKQLKPIKRMEV